MCLMVAWKAMTIGIFIGLILAAASYGVTRLGKREPWRALGTAESEEERL